MWIFWIIVISVVAVMLFLYSCSWQGLAGQLYVWCILAIFLIVSINTSEPNPTALDVYRGNTELKIISVNGIPTDTVVIYKNNKNL